MKVKVTSERIDDPKKKTKVKITGGGGNQSPTGLSYDQINKWSDFVEKNPSTSLLDSWAAFDKSNPGHGIDFNILRQDLDKLKQSAIKKGSETGSTFGESLHTGLAFPRMRVDGKDLGRVNADMKTQMSSPQQVINPSRVFKSIPSGAEDVWFDEKENWVKFVDPTTGDISYADRINLNHPKIRKQAEQQRADLATRQSAVAKLSPSRIMSGR